jgi:ceramide glucosyltransferase
MAGRSWEQVVTRFTRWLMVIRVQRPALLTSYPLLFFATPLILLCAAITAAAAPRIAAVAALLAIVSRLFVALAASWACGRPLRLPRAAVEAILGDIVFAAAFARVLKARKVVWRDAVITMDRSGRVREGAPEAAQGGVAR